MNAPVSFRSITHMTSDGQVLIPKEVRDRIGLTPGQAVAVGINDRGEAVVLPQPATDSTETREDRAARIEAAIGRARALHLIDGTTDEIMRDLRGDDRWP